MATFTMDESMAPIRVPKLIDTVMSHLFVGARTTGSRHRRPSNRLLLSPGLAISASTPTSKAPCELASNGSAPSGYPRWGR